jgi:hypothetical protein
MGFLCARAPQAERLCGQVSLPRAYRDSGGCLSGLESLSVPSGRHPTEPRLTAHLIPQGLVSVARESLSLNQGATGLHCNSRSCSHTARVLPGGLPREAYTARPACPASAVLLRRTGWRCRKAWGRSKAGASSAQSKCFAQFGCGFATLRSSFYSCRETVMPNMRRDA